MLAAVLAIGSGAPASGQGPSGPTAAPPIGEPEPAAGRTVVEGALRVASAYVARGFVAEDAGLVVQPELQAVYTALDRER